ncbi:30S ribosomal protein S20 [Bremerella alba]|uniref:Small ribosomal subunit protein bS20 n=1 Tax=Bremerella alba TaxID=980252 RepID=A0A7V8V6Q4_9BACT|nr:30S ribosomal protein S20 [Bremerella alba]MBA2115969.1 30S ribosomal protein S20 [Bremerella alba]
MPNTKSAQKRLRQNAVRRTHNRAVKSSIRSTIRKVREAVSAKEFEKADELFRVAVKKLDKAGAKHVFHQKTTSRLKSRLNQHIKSAKDKATA